MLGSEKAHGEKDDVGLDDFLLSVQFHEGTSSVGIGFPDDTFDFDALHLSVFVADEAVGVEQPTAFTTFLMGRCRLQDDGPVGPRCVGIVTIRRLGHNLNLCDALASLTMGCADAVGPRVTTADDEDVLVLGCDAFFFREFHTGEYSVLLREKFEGEMDAFQFTTRRLEVTGCRGACGEDDGIVFLCQFCNRLDVLAVDEVNAFLLHDTDTAVDDALVQLEVRDAVAQQSASRFVLLEHSHLVTFVVELVGSSKTCRTTAHDGHFLAVASGMFNGYISFLIGTFGDGGFVFAVGDSLACCMVQHTSLFAESRTDTSRKFREVVGRFQKFIGGLPVAAIEGIVPFRIFVSKRTCPVTERDAAVHATARLLLPVTRVQRLFHFTEVVDSVMYRSIPSLFARYGHKCFRISHYDLRIYEFTIYEFKIFKFQFNSRVVCRQFSRAVWPVFRLRAHVCTR